jgi:hypothetical protein
MSLNRDNKKLITCDTKGFLYLWDISKSVPYASNSSKNSYRNPLLLNAWRCHDTAILSCVYINEKDTHVTNKELIATTSSDWCCRLWTIDGAIIGAFGQESKWNLNDIMSYQSLFNIENDLEKLIDLESLQDRDQVKTQI